MVRTCAQHLTPFANTLQSLSKSSLMSSTYTRWTSSSQQPPDYTHTSMSRL